MYKLGFFVPPSHVEQVKAALFEAGAGRLGNYDSCCWQTLGEGQFRALQGSDAFIGELGKIEKVREYRVELVCEDDKLTAAVAALRASHPYEEVAFDVVQLVTFP
jgi:hypothetical protein